MGMSTIMRRSLMPALFFYVVPLSAQKPYFQQELKYRINVELNDTLHTLTGDAEILYINNSPDTLDHIYFHLWPNAYSTNNSALAAQLLESGKSAFYFSQEHERGRIDSLAFTVDSHPVQLESHGADPDICRILLKSPLQPGAQVTIRTPFRVKIPDARFSRLGHTGQAYFITQWYPKPAVYDQTGWHAMPYLDQGEFYGEYGTFDVSITLPQNYYLAATGNRQDASEEEAFINKRVAETGTFLHSADTMKSQLMMAFPPSSREKKTVRFIQKDVHDFAWFADKRFFIMKGEVKLPESGRKVETWAYFTAVNSRYWKKSLDYLNGSTYFYSRLVGEYPYDHVTAVDGTIMAGGGMEYPNITVIGNVSSDIDLDLVITHEVGHNWFYGILGSNERDSPFLDEGINSFYEMRYTREKYPAKKLSAFIGQDSTFRLFGLNKTAYWRFHELLYGLALRSGYDQPVDLPATAYSGPGYGAIIYSKTPLICDYIMDVTGQEKFDSAMHAYFEKFKFRHPVPSDFYQVLEEAGPALRPHISGLFSCADKVDYKIKNVRRGRDNSYVLKVKNKGKMPLPFNVYAMKDNITIDTVWSPGFRGDGVVRFPANGADRFQLDGAGRMPDLNRANNSIRSSGLLKKYKPLQLNFITKLEDPGRTQLHFLPLIGYNYYSQLMAGVSLHNYGFFPRRFQFSITPLLSMRIIKPIGFAEMNYRLHPQKHFQSVTFGVKAKSFAYDEYRHRELNYDWNDVPLQAYYRKVAPYISVELKKPRQASTISTEITVTSHNLFTDSLYAVAPPVLPAFSGVTHKRGVHSIINSLQVSFRDKRALDPYRVLLNFQQAGTAVKGSATFHYNITISSKSIFSLRVFAGGFFSGTFAERSYYAFRASGYSGYHDYLFEHNFIGRNIRQGFAFAQFAEEDGAVKVWSSLGQSPEWLTAVNLKSPAFLRLFRVYADAATTDLRYAGSNLILWDAGLNVTILRDIVEVYFPLLYSESIRENRRLNNLQWYQAARFTFNIHKLEPGKFIQNNFF